MECPMAKRNKPAAKTHGGARAARKAPPTPVRKKPTNLTLDPDAVARGEEYGRLHGASLSQLVTDLLYALPDLTEELQVRELTPAVQRLYGAAAKGSSSVDAREQYRSHLARKYGGRSK
jgi:hypothetical protein